MFLLSSKKLIYILNDLKIIIFFKINIPLFRYFWSKRNQYCLYSCSANMKIIELYCGFNNNFFKLSDAVFQN